jgi:DNA-binding NtrC family response regulator
VLLVDDEVATLTSTRRTLRARGFERVLTCSDSREVLDVLGRERVCLVLLDLIMPHLDGREVLEQIAGRYPELPVVVLTAEQEVATAVECMKLGAADYILKPAGPDHLVATIQKVLDQSALKLENARLRESFFGVEPRQPEAFGRVVTGDPGMLRVFSYIEAIAKGSQPVLIVGETGTGKELVARALHDISERPGPFAALNAAGLDDSMLSDALFGHKAGAFTGARDARKGMIETAGGGTLFLDEIGDLAEASQVKLLRLLQEREYYPLGSDAPRQLRARVVAATHRDPSRLRQDLYFRLRAYLVRLPPLRERIGDLPLLVSRFVAQAAEDLGCPTPRVPPAALEQLAAHPFPGNVRELQSLVFDAVARQEQGQLSVAALREGTRPAVRPEAAARPAGDAGPAPARDRVLTAEELKQLERENVERALRESRGRVAGPGGAAERLGLKPSTLLSRIKALGLNRGGDESR